jgi:hypothetical protein
MFCHHSTTSFFIKKLAVYGKRKFLRFFLQEFFGIRKNDEGGLVLHFIIMVVIITMVVIIYLSSYYFESVLLFHVGGIALTFLILPYILQNPVFLFFYGLAMFFLDISWYSAIYLVSFFTTCWLFIEIIFSIIFGITILGTSKAYQFFKNKDT